MRSLPVIFLLSLPLLLVGGPETYQGGICRGDRSVKAVSFVFTGGYHGEGAETILDVLKEKKAPGNFFLTGNYLRNKKYGKGIERMIAEGHYVGAHSDNHPKYVKSFASKGTLISQAAFKRDLDQNFAELAKFGVRKNEAVYFIPPYETYNQTIVNWAWDYGLILFNYTPGTRTNADYTDPTMKGYCSSKRILDYIRAEDRKPHGLNGHLMLIHLGTSDKRKDKFYDELGGLIDWLRDRGYEITSVPDLLASG